MNYKEALNILDETDIGNLELKIVLSRALERQIATKITHEATLSRCCTCPNCKNVVDEFIDFQGKKTRVTTIHCKFCGQALDWEDTQ